MATLGSTYEFVESNWKRYDANNYSFIHVDTNFKFDTNVLNYYNKTNLYLPDTIATSGQMLQFDFMGSKLRLLQSDVQNPKATQSIEIYIDGELKDTISQLNSTTIDNFKVLTYEITGLESARHSVILKKTDASKLFSLDAIEVDFEEGELLHKDEVLNLSQLTIGKKIRSFFVSNKSGEVGKIGSLGSLRYIDGNNDFIKPIPEPFGFGSFYFILVDDSNINKTFMADRNLQNNISFSSLINSKVVYGTSNNIDKNLANITTLFPFNDDNPLVFKDALSNSLAEINGTGITRKNDDGFYLEFTGDFSHVAISDQQVPNTEIVISFSIKTDTVNQGRILETFNSSNSGMGINIEGDGKISFDISDGYNDDTIYSNSSVNDNNWHNIMITKNTANKISIFIDDFANPDVVYNEGLVNNAILHSATLIMGKRLTSNTRQLKAKIKNLQIAKVIPDYNTISIGHTVVTLPTASTIAGTVNEFNDYISANNPNEWNWKGIHSITKYITNDSKVFVVGNTAVNAVTTFGKDAVSTTIGYRPILKILDLFESFYLAQAHGKFYTFADSQWIEINENTDRNLLVQKGFTNLDEIQTVDSNGIRPIDFLGNDFRLVVFSTKQDTKMKSLLLSKPKLIVMKRHLTIRNIYRLEQITMPTIKSNNSVARIALSVDKGQSWIGFDGTSFLPIPSLTEENIKTDGFTIENIQSIGSLKWSEILPENRDTKYLSFAIYLEEPTANDRIFIDEIKLKFSLAGIWKPAVQGVEMDYSYTDYEQLTVQLYEDGEYKINYYEDNPKPDNEVREVGWEEFDI